MSKVKKALVIGFVAGSILFGTVCGIGGYLIGANKLPKVEHEEPCKWEKCYCYDSFGRMLGYGSHCTVHGDGHECYQLNTYTGREVIVWAD